MDKKYLETAITLARLYGIGETLNPLGNLCNEDFIKMIKNWTEEFLSMGNNADILKFFESKINSQIK